MQYKRFNDTYMVRIDKDEEVVQSLRSLCEKESIRLAKVDAIGATSHGIVGVFDLEKQSYHQEVLDGIMEITSLSGNVTTMNQKPYIHLHATLADQNHVLRGGHVIELQIGLTCEMFVRVLDGEVERERNEEFGINVWKI